MLLRSIENGQYTSGEFRALLARHGIVQSLSGVGQCWDNAVAESFFGTIKEELVHRTVLPTRRHARLAIFEWIEVFYNRKRLHSALGYLSPADYERRRSLQQKQTQAARGNPMKTSNPIESTFAPVRARTKVTKGAGSRAAGLAMAFKLIEAAQSHWRSVNGSHLVALVRAGATFKKGVLVERDQEVAA